MSRDDSADAFDTARACTRSTAAPKPLRMWTLHKSPGGHLRARLLSTEERRLYAAGKLRVHCIVFAAEKADAESLALRLVPTEPAPPPVPLEEPLG